MIKINNLEQLNDAIFLKKAVFCPNSNLLKKPKPAAVVMNFQGHIILKLLQSGMYVYEKTVKRYGDKKI